jgi:hypothetical protein
LQAMAQAQQQAQQAPRKTVPTQLQAAAAMTGSPATPAASPPSAAASEPPADTQTRLEVAAREGTDAVEQE